MQLLSLLFFSFIYFVGCELSDKIIEKDLYKVLGLKNTATLKEIKKKYRKLAQIHHPDKSKKINKELNEAIFMEIAEAYEVLGSIDQRKEYDSKREELKQRRTDNKKSNNNFFQEENYRNEYQNNDQTSFFQAFQDDLFNMYEAFTSFESSSYSPALVSVIRVDQVFSVFSRR
jgi:curved DNA-binding protein CbpA